MRKFKKLLYIVGFNYILAGTSCDATDIRELIAPLFLPTVFKVLDKDEMNPQNLEAVATAKKYGYEEYFKDPGEQERLSRYKELAKKHHTLLVIKLPDEESVSDKEWDLYKDMYIGVARITPGISGEVNDSKYSYAKYLEWYNSLKERNDPNYVKWVIGKMHENKLEKCEVSFSTSEGIPIEYISMITFSGYQDPDSEAPTRLTNAVSNEELQAGTEIVLNGETLRRRIGIKTREGFKVFKECQVVLKNPEDMMALGTIYSCRSIVGDGVAIQNITESPDSDLEKCFDCQGRSYRELRAEWDNQESKAEIIKRFKPKEFAKIIGPWHLYYWPNDPNSFRFREYLFRIYIHLYEKRLIDAIQEERGDQGLLLSNVSKPFAMRNHFGVYGTCPDAKQHKDMFHGVHPQAYEFFPINESEAERMFGLMQKVWCKYDGPISFSD